MTKNKRHIASGREATYPTSARPVRFADRTHGQGEARVVVTGDKKVARKFNRNVLLTVGAGVTALTIGNAIHDNYEPSKYLVDTEAIAEMSPEEVSANYDLIHPVPGLGTEAMARRYVEDHNITGDNNFRDVVDALDAQAAEHDDPDASEQNREPKSDGVIMDHELFYLPSHPEDL